MAAPKIYRCRFPQLKPKELFKFRRGGTLFMKIQPGPAFDKMERPPNSLDIENGIIGHVGNAKVIRVKRDKISLTHKDCK